VPTSLRGWVDGPWRIVGLVVVAAMLCVAALTTRAEPPAPAAAIPSLEGRVEVLRDPSRAMTLGDVLAAADRFRPVRGSGVNLGYTRDAAWLRLRVPGTVDQTVLLALTPNFVDLVDVYVAQEPAASAPDGFAHFSFGDQRPLPDDGLSGLDDVVPIQLRSDRDTIIFIRVAGTNSSLNISASFHSPSTHTYQVTVGALLSGIWLGSMAALLITQLVFYYFDRESFFALLALSTLGAMLVYMGNLGLSRLLLFPDGGEGNDVFLAAAVWFGLAASSLAAPSILELPGRYPWVNRIILAGAVFGAVGVVFAVLGLNLVFGPIGTWVALFLATLAMVVSIRSATARGTGARLRAAAYTILWFGAVATLVQRAGLLELPNWAAHSYAVSCLIQTLLLTASLAVRLRAVQVANKVVVAQALAAARTAERRAVEMVEERTRELAAAKQIAEEALRAELQVQERQVRFMEVISHQYRTPLASIRSNVDSIGLSLPAADRENRKRIDRIRRGILRLVETLEINLARSRLQGTRFDPTLERIDVGDFVEAVAARARDFLYGEIVVEVSPLAAGAHILADAEMLGIALLNLLENAVKFTAQAGPAPVRLVCSIRDDRAVLAVHDRGIGIPADEIAGVLGRSVRASNARTVEGSGIGLSLVSRIVTAHRGSFRIESTAGVGTTATIETPLSGD
jgi:signal transduction histidine kinase